MFILNLTYPDHIFLYNMAGLLEIAVIAALVSMSDSLATLAMALALFRCASALWIYVSARKATPELFQRTEGKGESRIGQSLAGLWRPSLAFMLMPLVFGLNLQGYLLLVGAGFGAVVLAGFAATRTLTRLLDLFTNVAYGLQFYESGYLQGDRRAVQSRMLATMTLVSLLIAGLFALCLLTIGPWLQDLYTLGETAFSAPVALVLVGAATLRTLSAAPMAILAADNAHAPVITRYLIGSVVALGFGILLALAGAQLHLVLLPLLFAEACQLFPSMHRALGAVGMKPGAFVLSVFSSKRLEDMKALFGKLLART